MGLLILVPVLGFVASSLFHFMAPWRMRSACRTREGSAAAYCLYITPSNIYFNYEISHSYLILFNPLAF